ALIGVAIGVSTTLLISQAGRLRPRPSGMDRARRHLERSLEGGRRHLERTLEGGRRQVEDSVEHELRALTRAIRRGRRKLGL
ncbi:MAG: hypothetical protein ACYC3Q_07200, partial [Gemmatimonadaceae bacterium]